MKAVVKQVEDVHLPGIDRLRTLVYPHYPGAYDTGWHAKVWRWLSSHPAAEEMRRWVLVTEEDEVVGHLAATPQYYRIVGRRVVAHTPADYQVLPEYGFQALSLMRTFFRNAENCVACDMIPAVISVEERLGAGNVGKLRYAAKMLDVSRLPAPPIPAPLQRFLKLQQEAAPAQAPARGYGGYASRVGGDEEIRQGIEPPPVHPRAPIPQPVKEVLNRGLGVVDEALGGAFGGGFKVVELDHFDESFDEFFEKVAAVVPCTPEKDAAFLNWRYKGISTTAPVTVLGVRGEEELLGYAVLKVAAAGPDEGKDSGILDLTTLPGRHDVARALLRETVRHFRRIGAHIIRYRFMSSPTTPRKEDLMRFGFFYRDSRRNTLLAKFASSELDKIARNADNWSYSIGDGEATFWAR
ncbi:MAG: GNAT family N-acetyltransferase [Rubrobacteraceae bacterium]